METYFIPTKQLELAPRHTSYNIWPLLIQGTITLLLILIPIRILSLFQSVPFFIIYIVLVIVLIRNPAIAAH